MIPSESTRDVEERAHSHSPVRAGKTNIINNPTLTFTINSLGVCVGEGWALDTHDGVSPHLRL